MLKFEKLRLWFGVSELRRKNVFANLEKTN